MNSNIQAGLLTYSFFNPFFDVGESIYFNKDSGDHKLFSLLLKDTAGGVGLVAEFVDQLADPFPHFIAHTGTVVQYLIYGGGMNSCDFGNLFDGNFHERHLAFLNHL